MERHIRYKSVLASEFQNLNWLIHFLKSQVSCLLLNYMITSVYQILTHQSQINIFKHTFCTKARPHSNEYSNKEAHVHLM